MKFSPQIHLFLCLAMFANILAPAVVRADPPHAYAAEHRPAQSNGSSRVSSACSRINTPAAMLDENERKKNRERILANIKNSLNERVPLHRQLSNTAQQPNTVSGTGAHTVYYDYLAHTITTVCETQRKIHDFFLQYQKQIALTSQSTDKRDEAVCGSFQESEKLYASSSRQIGEFNAAQEKVLNELKKVYQQESQKNKQSILQFKERPAEMEKLKAEFGGVWGLSFFNRTDKSREQLSNADFPIEKTAVFGNVLYRLEQNKEDSKEVVAKMDSARGRMAASYKRCETFSAGAQLPVMADTASAESDITGNPEEKPGSETPGVTTAATDDDASQTNPADTNPTDTNPTDQTQTSAELAEAERLRLERENRVKVEPYVPPKDNDELQTQQQIPPPQKVEEEGWISRNKGLLLTVGAGAAAVGGILWYKKSQDKKAEEDANLLEMEARALASSNSSSTTTSVTTSTSTNSDSYVGGTPANGSTPQGSKLVVSGIPSGSVAVNATLPAITVAIINPAGILTQDSYTEVIVSCVEPAGCTLTGTGQARANVGKAKFSDLRFTSAHDTVKLLFTSPGFDSVMSATFSVTGGGGTATATDTSTDTSTNTDTVGGPRE